MPESIVGLARLVKIAFIGAIVSSVAMLPLKQIGTGECVSTSWDFFRASQAPKLIV